MALKTKVKVGNITNLSDARYGAGMGVDWLGFRIDSIDSKVFQDITGWVTGPAFVLELGDQPAPLSTISAYPTDWLELPPSQLSIIDQLTDRSILIRLAMKDWQQYSNELIALKERITYLIFDEGTGDDAVNQNILQKASNYFQILIGFNVSVDTIANQWNMVAGFNLQGSEELKPGLKEYQSLADVLEHLEVD